MVWFEDAVVKVTMEEMGKKGAEAVSKAQYYVDFLR